jgi:hypothetical protein
MTLRSIHLISEEIDNYTSLNSIITQIVTESIVTYQMESMKLGVMPNHFSEEILSGQV